jgi:hypothetical protein
MKIATILLLLTLSAFAKDLKQVEVTATHAVTHEDRGLRSTSDSVMLGAGRVRTMIESYNLDAIVDGEHVILACDDPKGCEAPALGKYEAELKRDKWLRMNFSLPVSHKQVSRWYKISGSW